MSIQIQRTSDGLPIVVGKSGTIYAGIPVKTGMMLACCRDSDRDVGTLTRSDFIDLGEKIPNEAALPGAAAERDEHFRQLAILARRELQPPAPKRTPWGPAQSATEYDRNVVFVSTASHGGFRVKAVANEAIPEPYRNANGWYEEDCEWAKVAAGLPHLFTDHERRAADRTLRNWFPDAYEAVNGVVLAEGESYVKDERLFAERHKDDFIVVSAIRVDGTTVKCTARKGGRDGGSQEVREFLVPAEEYAGRSPFGFIIDLERHEEITEAPSMSL